MTTLQDGPDAGRAEARTFELGPRVGWVAALDHLDSLGLCSCWAAPPELRRTRHRPVGRRLPAGWRVLDGGRS